MRTRCRATSSSAWESSSNQHGRRLIGWDEILEGGIPPNATVMSWRGIDGAIAAAKAGHDTVLSPAPDLYFDHWQSAGDLAPGRSNTLSLEMVYRFEPMPAAHPAGAAQTHPRRAGQSLDGTDAHRGARRIHGVPAHRGAGRGRPGRRAERIDWQDFQRRLEPQLRRYDKLGIAWAREVQLQPGRRAGA